MKPYGQKRTTATNRLLKRSRRPCPCCIRHKALITEGGKARQASKKIIKKETEET